MRSSAMWGEEQAGVGAGVGGSLLSEADRDTGWFVCRLTIGQTWAPAGHACNDVESSSVESAAC